MYKLGPSLDATLTIKCDADAKHMDLSAAETIGHHIAIQEALYLQVRDRWHWLQ